VSHTPSRCNGYNVEGIVVHPFASDPTLAFTGVFSCDMNNANILIPEDRSKLLHLGCGERKLEGAVNADKDPSCNPDVVCDFENPLPWPDNTFDCVHSSMVLEHVKNITQLADELGRITKPNAILYIATPWWSCHRAWGDPTHIRPWAEQTYTFWNKTLRDSGVGERNMTPTTIRADLRLIDGFFELNSEFKDYPPEGLDFACRHFVNVVEAFHAVLQNFKEA
jgi:SAM-dependent methyltransferase